MTSSYSKSFQSADVFICVRLYLKIERILSSSRAMSTSIRWTKGIFIYRLCVRLTTGLFVCFSSLIWRLFIFAPRLGEDGSSPRGDGRPALKYENGPFVIFISVPLSCEPKVCRGDQWSPCLSSTGVCFSKVPRTFWARKTSCQIAIRLFWKADLLTCFYCKKN